MLTSPPGQAPLPCSNFNDPLLLNAPPLPWAYHIASHIHTVRSTAAQHDWQPLAQLQSEEECECSTANWQQEGRRLQQLALNIDSNNSYNNSPGGVQSWKKSLAELLLHVLQFSPASLFNTLPGKFNSLSKGIDNLKSHDPLIFPGASATPPLPNEAPYDDPDGFENANSAIISLLEQHNANGFHHQAPLSSQEMVKAAIQFSWHSRQSRELLISSIQLGSGNDAERTDEIMSDRDQESILRNWIEKNYFGSNIADFLVKKISENKHFSDFTSADICTFLSEGMGSSNSAVDRWIWQHVVLTSVPIMALLDADGHANTALHSIEYLKINDFSWGHLHAGLLFLNNLPLGIKDLSPEQAEAWGKCMLALLEQGRAPQYWWNFFKLPTMLRYAAAGHIKEEMAGHALLTYSPEYNKLLEENLPGVDFFERLSNFKSRHQLAHDVIQRYCPWMSLNNYLNLNHIFKSHWYCRSIPPIHDVEDISTQYQREVDKVSDAYFSVNMLLILAAAEKLGEDEMSFIGAAQVIRMQAKFSATHTLAGQKSAGNFWMNQGLTIPLKTQVELFSARVKYTDHDEERIYALEEQTLGYQCKRVDKNRSNYYDLSLHPAQVLNDNDYQLKINALGHQVLKQKDQTLQALCEVIARKHQTDFAPEFYNHFYEKTGWEKTGDFVRGMVPFYTCLTSKDEAEAALSCSVDILMLVPCIGEISTLSSKFGHSLVKGSMAAMHHAANELAARSTLKEILQTAGHNFAEHGLLPASESIGLKELKSLLQTLDPMGLVSLHHIGRASFEQAIILGSHLKKNIPHLSDILSKLESSLKQMPLDATADLYPSGQLPGVAKDRPFLQSVKNMQEHGLSGRGAPRQAAIWASESSNRAVAPHPVSLSFLQILMRDTPEGIQRQGGMRGIATRHNLNLNELEAYLNTDLTLTEMGTNFFASQHPGHQFNPITDTLLIKWQNKMRESKFPPDRAWYCLTHNLNPKLWSTLIKPNGEFYLSGTRRVQQAQARITATDLPRPAVEGLPADAEAGPSGLGSALSADSVNTVDKKRLSNPAHDDNAKRVRIAASTHGFVESKDAATSQLHVKLESRPNSGIFGIFYDLIKMLPPTKRELVKTKMLRDAAIYLDAAGSDTTRITTMAYAAGSREAGYLIYAKNDIPPFTVLGPAANAELMPDRFPLQSGQPPLFKHQWDSTGLLVVQPTHSSNLLANANNNNVGTIQIGEDLKVYVTSKEIKKDEPLFVDYGNTDNTAI